MKKSELQKLIAESIEKENQYIIEHEEVKLILEKVNGKEFNGRVLNAKLLNGFIFSANYGLYYIKGKFEHLIGYPGNVIDLVKFEDHDACYGGAAKNRIEQLKNIDIDKVLTVFNKIEKHFNGLREAFVEVEKLHFGSYYFPVYYSLLNKIQGYKDENNKIRLSDFYHIRK